MLKKAIALISAAMLLAGSACAEGTQSITVNASGAAAVSRPSALSEGVNPLPINFMPGAAPQASGFVGELAYEDPSISVSIETGRVDGCDTWVATIRIADASQLRTVSAGGYNSDAAMSGTGMARRMKAVLAIDGDYFCYTGKGFILRQGELFLNDLQGDRDVLMIDENGDFHVYYKPEANSLSQTMDGLNMVNAFFFGPILVDNGEALKVRGSNMAENEKRQRMCIAQVGPLEYKAICCAAPARGSAGMTLQQFADFVAAQGVQTAYNLDGGDSCMMLFNYEKINDVRNTSTRDICDIIYFASAYVPGEAAK